MSLVETIEQMIDRAKNNYQKAAAMHSMSQVVHYGARVEALEDVMKLLVGTIGR